MGTIDKIKALIEADIAAGDKLAQEQADEDPESAMDFGGNQDDAYYSGEETGIIEGRANLAREILALIESEEATK